MGNLRVFVSYARKNKELVEQIIAVLQDQGLAPMSDKDLPVGTGFPEQIRSYIAHAHVFLPVVTPKSSKRGWVHQEIGYALALNVPVLPVCFERPPEGFLQLHHSLVIEKEEDLEKQLRREVFESLVDRANEESHPLYECAEDNEKRAFLMAKYANSVRDIAGTAIVRQKGALTTFSLPGELEPFTKWQARYNRKREKPYCKRLLKERQAFGRHVISAGCKLIVNDHLDYIDKWGDGVKHARLSVLLDFLESIPDDSTQVAFTAPDAPLHSWTLVGDWFLAESIAGQMGGGYYQTMFTRHAPTIRQRIEEFEQEFAVLLARDGTTAESSKAVAIERLKKQISALPPHPEWP